MGAPRRGGRGQGAGLRLLLHRALGLCRRRPRRLRRAGRDDGQGRQGPARAQVPRRRRRDATVRPLRRRPRSLLGLVPRLGRPRQSRPGDMTADVRHRSARTGPWRLTGNGVSCVSCPSPCRVGPFFFARFTELFGTLQVVECSTIDTAAATWKDAVSLSLALSRGLHECTPWKISAGAGAGL